MWKSLFITMVLPALIGAVTSGCGRSDVLGPGGTQLALSSAAASYCADTLTVYDQRAGICGCSEKESNAIDISDWEGCLDPDHVILQTLTLTNFDVISLAANYQFDSESTNAQPILYVGGCDTSANEPSIWTFESGTPKVSPTKISSIDLPSGEFPVSVAMAEDSWDVMTVDSAGVIRLQRLADNNGDRVPDTRSEFADFSVLEVTHLSAIEKLREAPVELRQDDDGRQVAMLQDGIEVIRVVDTNHDGTADAVYFPLVGSRPGSIVASGAVPSSSKVLVSGEPDTDVEVWTVDLADVPVALLGSGQTDASGNLVVNVSSLAAGTRLKVKTVASDTWGATSTVEAGDAPAAIALTPLSIGAGGTIDVYIPNAGASQVDGSWVYIDNDDWPNLVSDPCAVTSLGGDTYRFTVPVPSESPYARRQVLRIGVAGQDAPAHLDIAVASGP